MGIDGSSLPMTTLRFRAQIEINKINPYVLVDARRAARLQKNWRKPMPVCIQVNGKPDQPWRINMMPIGDGSFYLYLHGAVRKAAGAQVGDVVSVAVRFDDEYSGGPAHPMPFRFGAELKRNRRARHSWDALSPSRQKEILRYFAALKGTVYGEGLERERQDAAAAATGEGANERNERPALKLLTTRLAARPKQGLRYSLQEETRNG
jgi:hypothetical protein